MDDYLITVNYWYKCELLSNDMEDDKMVKYL